MAVKIQADVESKKTSRKGCTLAAVVDPALAEFVDSKHWEMRRAKGAIVTEAIQEWAEKHGFSAE